MTKSILAWHLIGNRRKLSHNGGPAKQAPGVEKHLGLHVSLCNYGLHASRKLEDASRYHKGPYLRRVQCSGYVVESDDKLVCTERKILYTINIEDILNNVLFMEVDRLIKLQRKDGCKLSKPFGDLYRVAKRWRKGKATKRQVMAAYNKADRTNNEMWYPDWTETVEAIQACAGNDVCTTSTIRWHINYIKKAVIAKAKKEGVYV
jgi:hypothetical protein